MSNNEQIQIIHKKRIGEHQMYIPYTYKGNTFTIRFTGVTNHGWQLTKLNPNKTELLLIPGDASPCLDLVIFLDNSQISPFVTAHNYGVTMENELSSSPLTAKLTCSCWFLLCNIRRIHQFLSTETSYSVFCLFSPLSFQD